jgi:hypothetical protein
MMAKFHVHGHRKLYIHNTLDQGADNAKSDIEKKLAEGNREGIGFDYMTCGLMLAFTFEAQINFMGKRFLSPWHEMQRWKAKAERVFKALTIDYDWKKRPFLSLEKMKTFRDTIAHGKPFEQNLDEVVEAASVEEAQKMFNFTQAWESMMTHEEIMQAYDDTDEAWKLMLQKSGLDVMETLDEVNTIITPLK